MNSNVYVVKLPLEIPHHYFDRLNSAPDFIVDKLREAYWHIPKDTTTFADSPQQAIGYVFRRNRAVSKIEANSLTKMFVPDAPEYAFSMSIRTFVENAGKSAEELRRGPVQLSFNFS